MFTPGFDSVANEFHEAVQVGRNRVWFLALALFDMIKAVDPHPAGSHHHRVHVTVLPPSLRNTLTSSMRAVGSTALIMSKSVSAATLTAVNASTPAAIGGAHENSDGDADIAVTATVRTTDRTGVEMEALTAVSVAALTLFDMIKAVDPTARIDDVRVLRKEGGKTGTWTR